MAKMKEDPLWMRIAAWVLLRVIWAVAGSLAFFFLFARDEARLMADDMTTFLLLFGAVAVLSAIFGPFVYKPEYTAGGGTLDKVKRRSRIGEGDLED